MIQFFILEILGENLLDNYKITKMRNLEVLLHASTNLIDLQSQDGVSVVNFTVDEFSHRLYILTTDNMLSCFGYSALLPANTCKLKYQVPLSVDSTTTPVSIKYVQELESLILIFTNGSILRYSNPNEEDDEGETQEMTNIPKGIIAASWSPNEEHLLVVQGDNKLSVFNTRFYVESSVNLDDNDETFAPDQEVTEELLAIKTAEITWKGDSRIFSINYSINGGFKCLTRDIEMNIIKGPARSDKENVTDKNVFSVSEKPSQDLRQPIAMMPSGSLIAGFNITHEEEKEPKHEIVFWEKNGLRHGQIQLPKFKSTNSSGEITYHLPYVRKLKFNSDTTFLAALIDFKGDRSTDDSIPKRQIIFLHRSNYHWFIKRSIGPIDQEEIFDFHWLSNKKNQMMILDSKCNFSFYDFKFEYQTSTDITYKDFDHLSYTANVDFTKLLITPFKKVVIPPPLAEKEIELEDIPQTLCFYKNNIFVILQNKIGFLNCVTGEIQFLDFEFEGIAKSATFIENHEGDSEGVLLLDTCVHNKKKDTLIELLIASDGNGKISIADSFKKTSNKVYSWCPSPYKYYQSDTYTEEDQEHNRVYIERKKEEPQHEDINPTMAMFLQNQEEEKEELKTEDSNCVFIQYLNKKIQKYTPKLLSSDGSGEFEDLWFEISHLCTQIASAYICGKLSIFTLSSNSKLSINGRLFSKECTSMLVTRDFIFFINSSQSLFHFLYVYNLNKKLPLPALDPNEPDPAKMVPRLPSIEDDSFQIRNVERGARLVCCNLTKTILQMPRGNLEGIRHRIPILYHAERLIEEEKYGIVFQMLRKNKINLNLICDINYEKFKRNVAKFIRQNLRVDYLDLFIMGLDEEESKELEFLRPRSGEDVIKRKFAEISGVKQKINEICDLMRDELVKLNDDKEYTLPILTTYVKKTPQQLIEALYLVKDLKASEKNVERKVIPPHLNPETMKKEKKEKRVYYEDALEYICWLVDANKLYNVALQTYDFDLVTMVATQTQKDPREFLPYLNSLKEMEPEYMKFKVQYDLKEYDLALKEISQADDKYFDEALAMIKKQRLYRQALRYYSDKPELQLKIKISFAGYLHDRKYYEEAGLMYKYAGEYEKALGSLIETPNYEMLFAVAQYLNYNKEDTHKLALEYSEKLAKEDNTKREAGIVLAKYHGHGDEVQRQAIDLLIKTKNYFFAIEKASEWNKKEFIDDEIKSGVKLAYELKFNDIEKRVKE